MKHHALLCIPLLAGCLIKADGPAYVSCDQANCLEIGEPITVDAGTDDLGTPLLHLAIDGSSGDAAGEAPETEVLLTWSDGFAVADQASQITTPVSIDDDIATFDDVEITLSVDDTETLFLHGVSESTEMTWACQALDGSIACERSDL